MAEETRSHETRVEIRATPEQIWQMLTEAPNIARWFAPEVTAEPGVGGKVFISWGGGMEFTVAVTQWEPGKYLRWEDPARAPLSTEFFIETKDGGTATLRLVQTFGTGSEWDGEFDGTKRGWAIFLRVIKLAIERHWGEISFPAYLFESLAEGATQAKTWQRLKQAAGIAWNVESSHEGDELVVLVPEWNESVIWFTLGSTYVTVFFVSYGLEKSEFDGALQRVTEVLKSIVRS